MMVYDDVQSSSCDVPPGHFLSDYWQALSDGMIVHLILMTNDGISCNNYDKQCVMDEDSSGPSYDYDV